MVEFAQGRYEEGKIKTRTGELPLPTAVISSYQGVFQLFWSLWKMLTRPDPGKQPSFPALVTVAVTSPADVMKCPDKKHERG